MNEFISSRLRSITQDSKYLKWYLTLVSRSSSVGEKHHIIPVSVDKNLKNTLANIVKLAPREHYIAHLLLIRLFTGINRTKMVRSLWFLSKRTPKINSRLFELYRTEWSQKMKNDNPMSRLKISKKLVGL